MYIVQSYLSISNSSSAPEAQVALLRHSSETKNIWGLGILVAVQNLLMIYMYKNIWMQKK